MILSASSVLSLAELSNLSETETEQKLAALELMIRAYTHNNFQNRFVRFAARSTGNKLYGTSDYLSAGDTVQISQSNVNDGLYTVTEVGADYITVGSDLFAYPENLVTKVEYPEDIKVGVLELLKYDVRMRDKAGIKSETLSRYSVTYADADASNEVMGYPAALLGFLKPYMKARF